MNMNFGQEMNRPQPIPPPAQNFSGGMNDAELEKAIQEMENESNDNSDLYKPMNAYLSKRNKKLQHGPIRSKKTKPSA